jgi:mRNA interferase RelE/StbE
LKRTVLYTERALRDLRALPRDVQDRIRDAVERFASIGHGDIKKLKGHAAQYRLRVGDYRVIFTYQDRQLTILVLRILDRKDAY